MLLAAAAASLLGAARAVPATIRGRRVLLEGTTVLHMKGVNWNPIPVGGVHPHGLDYKRHVTEDAWLMAEAGVNVLRTYEALVDREVLDELYARGIQVINTIWSTTWERTDVVRERVEAVKDHPAILMWSVGNEWNYNGCYRDLPHWECQKYVAEAARFIKEHDTTHPVATVYGNLPRRDVVDNMPEIDLWGINYYDELSFSDLFTKWEEQSEKPMFIGEYGADAWNANINSVDSGAQAHATAVLTQEITTNSVLRGGACSGGLIFELSDEWWKDGKGSPNVHDVGGVAPGGGPHPDRTFNEEWWGLTDIDRTPREAYHAFASVAVPRPLDCAGSVLPDETRMCSTADGCRVLASGMKTRSCAQYCSASSLVCVGAWQEVANTCNIQAQATCDEITPWKDTLLCECAGAKPADAAVAMVAEGKRQVCTRSGCDWVERRSNSGRAGL